MKRTALVTALTIILMGGGVAGAAPQDPRLYATSGTPQELGMSLLAATCNIVYMPVRLAITTVTAAVGGFTGWMTAGDRGAADAVWLSTDGPAYLTPAMLEGREPVQFGRR